ncbi:MAG: protein kinase [Candidatus Zixiibacteriota bacterium]|nr:MAG: protein kinase [candidate division Zixibacteria bacterium]
MISPGSTFGSFKIDEILGKGAMGVVYKALDTRLDRTVALKLINESLAESAEYRARLAEEAKIAARIDSPHVVKVWEHSELEGSPFISLEYVSGEELRFAAVKLELNEKIDLTLQIADGIKAAHDAGLIHRDLKPENIKLAPNGKIKILDFGLAKIVQTDSVDAHGNIEGSLYYLSPEQLSGETLAFSSDLFSLGTILYELFTGVRPFEGEYTASIIYSILHEEPDPPCEINRDLPDWLSVLITKLLMKNPLERYQNAAEVIAAIKDGLAQGPGVAAERVCRARQTVTVVDLKNLSGDESWDYFCVGFTEDVINELSRRTDLIITAEPSTSVPRNVREIFKHCRSDFVVVGSLMKWQNTIKLNLSIYGDGGDKLVSSENYEENTEELFDLLSKAARETSTALAKATGFASIAVDDILETDVSAYEFYLKGKSYYQTSKPDDLEFAADMFKRAIHIDPSLALAYSGLADVYAFQYMMYYDRSTEKINSAQQSALRAIETDPRLPEAHRALGRCYMSTGLFDKAEQAFLKAVEINPKYAIGYRTLAWLQDVQGNQDKAMSWARRALQLAPTDLETLLLISLINMDQRKYTLAMATLQRAIELGPDYGRAYYNLGTVYFKLGVVDLAIENFHLAIKYKGDTNCYIAAGYCHMINGEQDRAREYFQESVKREYLKFIAEYYLGYLEGACGNAERARVHFEASIAAGKDYEQHDPENPYVKSYRAMSLAAQGNADEAIPLLEELLAKDDLNGEVLCDVGRAYAHMGDAARAREMLDRAIRTHAGVTEKEVRLDPHFSLLKD